MTATVLSLLLMLVFLEILFSLGCGTLLLLRHTDAPPKGKRMRILWTAVLLLSLIPLRLYTPHTSVTVYESIADDGIRIHITETDTTDAASASQEISPSEDAAGGAQSAAPITIRLTDASVRIMRIALPVLLFVWLIGICVSILGTAMEHRRTASLLRIHSVPCTDDRILSVCRQCAQQIGIPLPKIRIFEEGMILSPCCSGIFRPTVYVSETQRTMSEQALSLILLHEFSHIRSRDPLLALLTSAACSLHWMNPLGETVRRAVAEDCEMSCDEEVLRLCGDEARIPYIHAILDIASGITAHAAETGIFSVVREHRAEFIKRRYDSMKNKKTGRLTTTLAVLMTAILLLGNVLTMSSCAFPKSASDSPAVTLQNPVLETALEEYFGVEQLTEQHMSLITSLEISVSKIDGTAAAGKDADGNTVYIPVRIRINGGVVPTSDGNFEATHTGYDMHADGFVFESLPIMLDKDALNALGEAIRSTENGEWNYNKLLAFYCIKDATEETVTAQAYAQLVQQFCGGVSTARVLDVNGDGVIDDKDSSMINTTRTYQDAETVVAALPADVREEYMMIFIARPRAELLSLYPFAEARPMAILDPETKPREATELMKILHSASLLENRVLTSTEFDLADTALMSNLTTLTLDETLTALNMPE